MIPNWYQKSVEKFKEVSKSHRPKKELFKLVSEKRNIPLLVKDRKGSLRYNKKIYNKLRGCCVYLYNGKSDRDGYEQERFWLYDWVYYW